MKIIQLEIETKLEGLIINTYIVYDEKTKEALVIDPADSVDKIADEINKNNLKLKYIAYTHCHTDHITGIKDLKERFKDALIIGSVIESENINNPQITAEIDFNIKIEKIDTDIKLEDGDEINLGEKTFEIILTPGHTSGSMSIYSKEEKAVFTGDTLFVRGYGRTDLPTGNINDIYLSLRKLLSLPIDIKVYPGHGNTGKIKDCK